MFSGKLYGSQPAFLVGKGKAVEGSGRETGDVDLVSREEIACAEGELYLDLGLKVTESGSPALVILSM